MGREFDTLKENETEKVVYCNTIGKIYQFATLTDLFNIYKNELEYKISKDFIYEDIWDFFSNTGTSIKKQEADLLINEYDKTIQEIEAHFDIEE